MDFSITIKNRDYGNEAQKNPLTSHYVSTTPGRRKFSFARVFMVIAMVLAYQKKWFYVLPLLPFYGMYSKKTIKEGCYRTMECTPTLIRKIPTFYYHPYHTPQKKVNLPKKWHYHAMVLTLPSFNFRHESIVYHYGT